MPRRWPFLLLVPVYVVVLFLVATVAFCLVSINESNGPRDLAEGLRRLREDDTWWRWGLLVTTALVALQIVFLLPLFARTPPRGSRSRPLVVSLLVGGVLATVLTAGLAMAFVEVVGMLAPDLEQPAWLFVVLVIGASWIGWSLLLLLYAREIWPDRALGRLVALLFAGTAIETIVVLPIDAMVRRRTDCYCGEGTYFSLVIGTFVTLWLVGPGIVIALVCRRHRRWRETHCVRCGYPTGPSRSARCPECGTERGGRPRGAGRLGAPPEEHERSWGPNDAGAGRDPE